MLVSKKQTQPKYSVILSCLCQQLKQQFNYSKNIFGLKNKTFPAKAKKPPTTAYYKVMFFLISHIKEIGISLHQVLYWKKFKGIGRKVTVSLLQDRNCHNRWAPPVVFSAVLSQKSLVLPKAKALYNFHSFWQTAEWQVVSSMQNSAAFINLLDFKAS